MRMNRGFVTYGIVLLPILKGWGFTVSLFSGTGWLLPTIALAARLVASRIPERQIGLEIRRTSPFGETAIERRSFPLEGDSIRITKGSGSVIDCEWILQERLQLDGAETGLWQLSVSPIDTNLLTAIYGIGLSYKDSYGKR